MVAERERMSNDDYPFFGYIYNADGYHPGPVELGTQTQLYNFLDRLARVAIAEKREVIVTDNMDFCVFQAKDGKVIWPDDDVVKRHAEGLANA
jgi:hypothetical protein